MLSANLSGAKLGGANLSGANLIKADLSGAMLREGDLSGAYLERADPSGAKLFEADLSGANLREADLSGANFPDVNLSGANLLSANLSGADLIEANLRGADLESADLSGAKLGFADLSGANLRRANLSGADFDSSTLEGVRFESIGWGHKPIDANKFITARGLDGMYFLEGDGSLVALRSAFRERQLSEQARAISVSISRGRQRAAFYRCSGINECDPFEVLAAAAAIVFFELPVEYGARPFRALWILLVSVFAFGLLYYFLPTVVANPMETVGDFLRVKSIDVGTYGDSAIKNTGHQKSSLIEPWEWGFRDALWFSFLSATHFGTKFLNAQTIFRRLQREDYVVEATGWLRVMSAAQSILSVYLLGLFAITYFQSRVF